MKVTYGGFCEQCGGINEAYMVNDYLWQTFTSGECFICISCFESRLNRKLTIKDFTSYPINYGLFGFNCIEYCKERN